MFKLLTEEESQKVAREYGTHRAVVMLSAFILVLVIGIIGLLPSYVLSNARQTEVFERMRIMGISQQNGNQSDLQVWLNEINHKLQILSPKLDTDRPSDFIDKILDQKIKGIGLSGFVWSKTGDKITLSVNGIAQDRQTLITFQDRIKASGHFSEVTLPISNLAKDRNIDFQIKLSQ